MNQPAPETKPNLRGYLINISNGPAIPCDADEIPKTILAIRTGAPCVLRGGIFNPSYWLSTTEDTERINEVRRQNEVIRQQNEQDHRNNGGRNQQIYKGLEPIKDIFEGINLKGAGNNLQQSTGPTPEIEAPRVHNKPKQVEEGQYLPR